MRRANVSLFAETLRLVCMPLESCPTCGYALSTFGNHCRHCASSFTAVTPFRQFDAKLVAQLIGAVVVLSVLIYLLFFR